MAKLAVLASGEGTNFQAIVDAARSGWLSAQVAVLISSRKDAGALRRAREAGIETTVLEPTAFPTPEAYGEALAKACRDKGVDLICLAGYLPKLPDAVLKAFPGKVLNIHPGLLPAFGGKGMYGRKVHEAVIAAGAKVTGCTVHIVDEEYDHGPIVLQATVPVADGDTPETLAARVLEVEHHLYPKAVKLFCEGRVHLEGRMVRIKPETAKSGQVRRALISVSDKTGVIELARELARLGVELVSTGGTAKALAAAGLYVRPLGTMTHWPEMFGGRVKTLHPAVHGGILFRRDDPEHAREAAQHMIEPIDLVVVNLYPFAEAAKKHRAFEPELIEEIDIGGPTLVRGTAKNCDSVAIVTSPADYGAVVEELKSKGELSLETRRNLARKAFQSTAAYDAEIARALSTAADGARFPAALDLRLDKVQDLRYGENPHQAGALYRVSGSERPFEQLQGKELSYNNLLDAEGAWGLVQELDGPAAVIFKHVTPCGAGAGRTIVEAYRRAWEADGVCAFGGILALNRPLDAEVAKAIGEFFLEVIVAPEFTPEARELLQRKKNLRLLERRPGEAAALEYRVVGTEVLVQEPDKALWAAQNPSPPPSPTSGRGSSLGVLRHQVSLAPRQRGRGEPGGLPHEPGRGGGRLGKDEGGGEGADLWKVVTRRAPTPEESEALRFAWPVSKYTRSNAIVVATSVQTLGIGAGQMSRVDAVQVAAMKLAQYAQRKPIPATLAAASDAFFPFRDGIDELAKLNVTAIAQPGGSVRDEETIKAADERGMAMVFTGMRHFRH